MGQHFQQRNFSASDKASFNKRINQQAFELKDFLSDPVFNQGETSLGAEVELFLVDQQGLPACYSESFIKNIDNALIQEELNQYNLELNLSPVKAKGKPFSTMQKELVSLLDLVQSHAKNEQMDVVTTGILPTLEASHLSAEFLTDRPRYKALNNILGSMKGSAFEVTIAGQDNLKFTSNQITMEGANTSMQIHLRVPAERFANLYNAAQIATFFALALSGNSPIMLGKRLWQETRIALFKQSIDTRDQSSTQWHQPTRVPYGMGWIREGAWEIFAQSVALHPPLLPYLFDEEDKRFQEINLHHGTVYNWNRAILAANTDPHLRIEFRALPAGPTVIDMMANAAFIVGLTLGLEQEIDNLTAKLPFEYAEFNFYRAAKEGLSANILWPQQGKFNIQEQPVHRILQDMLSVAESGLVSIAIEQSEISKLMAIIQARLANRQTGAQWQLRKREQYHNQTLSSSLQPVQMMLRDYIDNMRIGAPVATWN